MAIFVTGDVHGGAEYGSSRFSSKSWPDGRTLSRDDEWRDGRHRLIYRDIVPVGVRREDEDREPVG